MRHRLLAACDDDVELTGADQLIGERDGVDAGQAHLVDGQRGHVPADARGDGGLPGRHLPGTGGQHLAHDHVLDGRGGHSGLLQRTGDGDRTQIAAREILQRAHQLADRSTGSSNDHRRRHLLTSRSDQELPMSGHRTVRNLSRQGYRYVMTTEQVDARPVLASALVTAIDHVGIAVADLDVAIKWYHDHLGMIVLHEEVNEDQGIREAMLSVRGAPESAAPRSS